MEPSAKRRVFIQNFGCQMNDYDVERMREVLARATATTPPTSADEADLIVINTCAIREKAEAKVASRGGAACSELKEARPGVMVAIGGLRRAAGGRAAAQAHLPVADFTFGPDQIPSSAGAACGVAATRRGASPRPRSSTSRTIAFSTPSRGRGEVQGDGARRPFRRAATTTAPSAWCRRRAAARCRGRADEVVAEVRALRRAGRARGHAHRAERELVSRHRHAPTATTSPSCSRASTRSPGLQRLRYTTSHPQDFTAKVADAFRDLPHAVRVAAPAGAVGLLAHAASGWCATTRREEYLRQARLRARRCARTSRCRRTSSSAIRARPTPTSRRRCRCSKRVEYDSIYSFEYSRAARYAGAQACAARQRAGRGQGGAAASGAGAAEGDHGAAARRAASDATSRCWSRATSRAVDGQLCGRTTGNEMVNFAGPPSLTGQLVDGARSPPRARTRWSASTRSRRIGLPVVA